MEKQKRWQFYLILAVTLLTLYNILPTLFYYSKPLASTVNETQAEQVAKSIVDRLDTMEDESLAWIHSFSKLLDLHPEKVALRKEYPGIIDVSFRTEEEAARFKRYLPKAGALIPFVPAQLSLFSGATAEDPRQVLVERQISIKFDPQNLKQYFYYYPKYTADSTLSLPFKTAMYDKASQLAFLLSNPSKEAETAHLIISNPQDITLDASAVALARQLNAIEKSFSSKSPLYKRFLENLNKFSTPQLSEKLVQRFEQARLRLTAKIQTIEADKKGEFNETQDKLAAVKSLNDDIADLEQATKLVKASSTAINKNTSLSSQSAIYTRISKAFSSPVQALSLEGKNPYVKSLSIDWAHDRIVVELFDDLEQLRQKIISSEADALQKEKMNQLLINALTDVSRQADEELKLYENQFAYDFSNLENPSSFLQLDLSAIADAQANALKSLLPELFHPQSGDLAKEAYPIRTYAEFTKEKPEEKQSGFVIYAPVIDPASTLPGFRNSSVYVIAKGLNRIIQKHESAPESTESKKLIADLQSLNLAMQKLQFIGYPGSSFGFGTDFANDFIFELDDFYASLLKATRENFEVKGSKRYAMLPFTNLEQRILTENKIADRTQEDLLKWVEAYASAQIDPDPLQKLLVPAPTQNPYWSNFKISLAKYFRGDDRKILKWGLDLSGGKTVRIGLVDANLRPVTNPEEIHQAVNELYTRVNKMGVSERTLRVENQNIILEFPGSQQLSADELIKASSMYFHVVNEKFSTTNLTLREAVNQFLQEVWNEAVVTNRKDIENIKEIAWQHFGGHQADSGASRPFSEYAKTLYENGLRLAEPRKDIATNSFNDELSTIAMMRGDDFTDWAGQTHPLLFVFHNYALEGSNLNNIHATYDPSEGNGLSFDVKRVSDKNTSNDNPRQDFYAWTSQFAEDKIAGTPKEAYTHGRGWRMAVILNGSVVSQPSLKGALRDTGRITGRFTQREINQLVADLKAGSLSFTPKILSEQNISPELGKEERWQGIFASCVALLLVAGLMIGYYRFAGVVATCAVFFNIFIMWGILQNLEAALTLPAIAGIVLTIGMAVDANVLVFERIREEFAASGRIASAIQAGYRKAFSAILDSNITTVIAALILIQFDTGPIKGFAVSLMVGILSSMFTSLFMTRYFFAGWVQNPAHKTLTMGRWFEATSLDFLKYTKIAFGVSAALIVAGSLLIYQERRTLLGMDFTGGYALTVELKSGPADQNFRKSAYEALLSAGASPRDILVRELSKPTQLKIQLGHGLEEKGQPFFTMSDSNSEGSFTYEYQKNPRIVWVVKALEKEGLQLSDTQLSHLSDNWTVMSGQLSSSMRNQAVMALALALFAILVYITFRFEFKFAISAVVGLLHDLLITLGFLAFFHALGWSVQIDMQVIGALMTIIGYSLNDTIIVFDRIREDSRNARKLSYYEIINKALNMTLNRTMMTSGTTLLVLLALVIFGGSSIFAFSLVMTLGVVVGTLSSLFIASPVLLYIHNKEEGSESTSRKISHSG